MSPVGGVLAAADFTREARTVLFLLSMLLGGRQGKGGKLESRAETSKKCRLIG